MAEDHAFINRLQQVRAGVQRLHPVKTAGHLQSGIAAVEKRQKKEVATGFRQAGNRLVDLIKREVAPLGGEPFKVAGRGRAGFVNDILPVIDVAAIDVRMGLMVAQTVSDAAGDGLRPHHRIER